MAQEQIKIEYNGIGLADGTMDVRDLAPSLLAFGDLMHIAQATLFPHEPRVAVRVSETRQGSFEVFVEILTDFHKEAVSLLSGQSSQAITNLGQMVKWVMAAVALMVQRGRTQQIAQEPIDPEHTMISFADGTSMELHNKVLETADRVEIKRSVRQFVNPVAGEEVSEVDVHHREETLAIERGDLPALEPTDDAEDSTEYGAELTAEVVSPAFIPGNKWRLRHDGEVFWARIEDEQFTSDVANNRERFGSGDLLRVHLTSSVNFAEAGRPSVEHVVTEVREHVAAAPRLTQSFHHPGPPVYRDPPPLGTSDDQELPSDSEQPQD